MQSPSRLRSARAEATTALGPTSSRHRRATRADAPRSHWIATCASKAGHGGCGNQHAGGGGAAGSSAASRSRSSERAHVPYRSYCQHVARFRSGACAYEHAAPWKHGLPFM